MTEVQHLHGVLVFADLVVHENGAMKELALARAFPCGATDAGKAPQKFHMIKQGISEAGRNLVVIIQQSG